MDANEKDIAPKRGEEALRDESELDYTTLVKLGGRRGREKEALSYHTSALYV